MVLSDMPIARNVGWGMKSSASSDVFFAGASVVLVQTLETTTSG